MTMKGFKKIIPKGLPPVIDLCNNQPQYHFRSPWLVFFWARSSFWIGFPSLRKKAFIFRLLALFFYLRKVCSMGVCYARRQRIYRHAV